MARSGTTYRGRFAPSPTGPLHQGSLIAALASCLHARHQGGQWLLRMEDLDPPREEPGAAAAILQSLLDHGLRWDGEVLYQRTRSDAYDRALAQLTAQGLVFHCDCSRAMLGPGGSCGGRCAPRQDEVAAPWALRLAVRPGTDICFIDQVQGRQQEALARELPDFTLLRKDGLYAYQLAVVVDDAYQGISHVVRGSDLLGSAGRQIYLQQQLGLPQPDYCHIPVITNSAGQKFSKQNHAPALLAAEAPDNLRRALQFLQQPQPPAELQQCGQILDFATYHWSTAAVPAVLAISA
ncbi:tRNA glutamyl-Q(34) synthetase GluQRS [Seongchinamella sediminis]|uniref:Glutamyl-Q tRNA(Asp) synthetase n=1 Tax=Seongchinamella sediminis TaxID=2283635 RepID=A0A3L7DSZ0_9GAMM|nr:tRNA glutamyl-Q(34) synthetase GluQRS [Seongchinamella sediminis]RLQ20474.1 tRNA glutamyl-Q(34) synthetase GluQRS [Seongchinamella sediminis]